MNLDDLRQHYEQLRQRLQDETDRLRARFSNDESQALAAMARPNLGPTPEPLRRYLEPLVAGAAAAVLVLLAGLGLYGFTLMFVAAALIYAILTFGFGIEFDLNVPV